VAGDEGHHVVFERDEIIGLHQMFKKVKNELARKYKAVL
jgi:hypothetical protein